MPAWDEVVKELEGLEAVSPLDTVRAKYISELAEVRGRNVICYYSGWLQKKLAPDVDINDGDMNGLMNAVHGLDRSKGLDFILHTPGGNLAATEAIVNYLRECFGTDVVAIVPQLAMSAGTMIACSCHEIIMGRQSSLGPTDPQMGGVPAGGVVREFEEAVAEVTENPASAVLWGQIIGQYHPTFLGDCQMAVDMSRSMVKSWLMENMLSGRSEADNIADSIVDELCEHGKSVMHDRHYSAAKAKEIGLNVSDLEENDVIQDLVLTVHHAFMNTFSKSPATKIIENSAGKRWIISAVQ